MNKSFVGVWGLAAAVLFTARAGALQITPTYQIFTVKAGEETTGELTLTNTEDADVTVNPELKEWFTLPANKDFKVEDWLKVMEPPFTFKPGESRKIRFIAKAPKKAKGELVGMLSFLTRKKSLGSVTFRLSVGIYVAVQGTEKFEGEVSAVSVKISTPTKTTEAGILLV